MVGDSCGYDVNWVSFGDQYIFIDQIEVQCCVDGIVQWIENGVNFIVDFVWQWYYIECWQL